MQMSKTTKKKKKKKKKKKNWKEGSFVQHCSIYKY